MISTGSISARGGSKSARGGSISARGQRGSASVLIIGFAVVIVLTIVVVVDASAAYLRRQALANLADGAALAAADGVKADQAYAGSVDDPIVDAGAARRHATDYLRLVRAGERYPGLAVTVRVVEGAVVVRVTAPLELPITLPDLELPDVGAEAAALVVVGD